MQLTSEQIAILESFSNIKINAVAGSGKTTTLIEYAKSRPSNAKILYLVFNKAVKLEAKNKFEERGLSNVQVETAHSLAFKHIMWNSKYRLRKQEYSTSEIVEILSIQGNEEKHTEYVFANHVNKFMAYFCNSDKQKVQNLNYLDIVSDTKAMEFVRNNYDEIVKNVRILLKKMNDGVIACTHDFYLKKFQVSNPKLDFDYILFDEGQDTSPTMLDVFLKQTATKVIVGDTHQQIYSWRFAVNSLEKVDFEEYRLSTSFRFNQDIANLAMKFLEWKEAITGDFPIPILGKGSSTVIKTQAVIARTNLGLLLKAIEYVTERDTIQKIYFEGNINSYTYADDGASLYDVLNLYNDKRSFIRDKLISKMRSLKELEEYIEKTEDVQLKMMVEIVKEYGNEIPAIIKQLKEKHVEKKEDAEVIFSTVHRCKGMEYDTVLLVNDFVTLESTEKIIERNGEDEYKMDKLIEEINLLYVAVTRSRNSVYIFENSMPLGIPVSKHIRVLKEVEIQEDLIEMDDVRFGLKSKPYTVKAIRKTQEKDHQHWDSKLDDELTIMYCEGINLRDMTKHFGRTKAAIQSRIEKLELRELYGK